MVQIVKDGLAKIRSVTADIFSIWKNNVRTNIAWTNVIIAVGTQGCIKLVSVVSRIPDKLLMVRQMTLKITTKKVGTNS